MSLNPKNGPPNLAWAFVVVIILGGVMTLLARFAAVIAKLME